MERKLRHLVPTLLLVLLRSFETDSLAKIRTVLYTLLSIF